MSGSVLEEAPPGAGLPASTPRRAKLDSEVPSDYMHNPHQEVVTSIEDIYARMDSVVASKDYAMFESMIHDIVGAHPTTEKEFNKGETRHQS